MRRSSVSVTVAAVLVALAAVQTGLAAAPTVVVTTSMLECAARELLPAGGEVEVVRLMPAGSCPGHFDLTPRELLLLQGVRLFIRHDFQRQVEAQLQPAGLQALPVVEVGSPGSLLVPEHYGSLLDRLATILADAFPGRADAIRAARVESRDRLRVLADDLRRQGEPWRGRTVIASIRQSGLCRFLGLEVIGELPAAEQLEPRELERLLALRPDLIVGNLQEGTELAHTVAARLQRPLAVLSSFPAAPGFGTGYDERLQANLSRLGAAWPRG